MILPPSGGQEYVKIKGGKIQNNINIDRGKSQG